MLNILGSDRIDEDRIQVNEENGEDMHIGWRSAFICFPIYCEYYYNGRRLIAFLKLVV
jgi:hypothetical protein